MTRLKLRNIIQSLLLHHHHHHPQYQYVKSAFLCRIKQKITFNLKSKVKRDEEKKNKINQKNC